MRLNKKSISKVGLLNVLRRRRSNLSQFLKENGIVTYELLLARCDSMGVTPPSLQEFTAAAGGGIPQVSSPTEGVVIVEVEAKHPVSESTGRPLQVADSAVDPDEDVLVVSDSEATLFVPLEDSKKRKKSR